MRPLTGRLLAVILASLAVALLASGIAAVTLAGARPLPVAGAVAVLFALACIAIAITVRRLDRRLEAIATAASSLASGDLSARAPIVAHDELTRLARVLNDLAKRTEATVHDLTAQRDSSDAVLGSLPQGVALVTRDLGITHASARFWELVGVGPPELPSRLSIARQPVLEELVLESAARRATVTREVAFYLDEKREYEIVVAPITSREPPEEWLLTIQDLRPEQALAALRREFAANASHELKTPLTSIRGYAETLLSGGLEDVENRARFVETIRVQAARLEALVQDLLDLADLERPDSPLDLKDWDMGQIAREMGTMFEDLARRGGLKLEVTARQGIRARVDRTKIELALRNLFDNAIKYTDAGSIRVHVEETPAGVRINVADTGRGIPPEHLSRIFERFYRVDRGRSRARGGTGLGLSIVKHAVLLHDGKVGVESTLGSGSAFWLEIPRAGPRRQS
jgi:two-component system phosphate regulon sensor histidine kinase PhoR